MNRFFLLFSLIFSSQFLFAQNGTIEGTIKDENKQALAFATVTIFKVSDTSIVNYKLTDPSGKFKINQVPLNENLRILVSFMGYESYRYEFMLSKDSSSKSLGDIIMSLSNDMMETAVVTAEQPPVVMRKDTIEFNAAAFKTLPTAMVDELLNKLPGVTMTEDGQFMVNGRKVNRILVDGKEFFGNDLKATTKNLPAFTIDKVQVHNDERDLFADPNRPLNEVGQVINLKLKKEYKKGLFGKVYAGGGTDERYEAGGIVNMFRDTTQISLLAYTNNLSKSGISMQDMMAAGGMDRSGFTSVAITDGGGFSLNGVNLGGMAGAGIENVYGAGININHNIRKKLDLNGQYYFNQSRNLVNSQSTREQYIQNDVLKTSTTLNRVNQVFSHQASLRAYWKVDTTMNIEFTPNIKISHTNQNSPELSNTIKNSTDFLNSSDNQARSKNDHFSYGHYFNMNKRFNSKSSVNINNSIDWTDRMNELYNKIINAYLGEDSIFQNRRRQTDDISKSIYVNTTYNYQINKIFDLKLDYKYSYGEARSGVFTYDSPFKEELYNIYITDLSNDFKRVNGEHSFSSRIGIKTKKVQIFPSLRYTNLSYENQYISLGNHQKNNYDYLLPGLELRFLGKYSIGYSKNVSLPSITQMQPVVNANNPLNIIEGNPNLKPITHQSLHLNIYEFTNPKFNYNVFLWGTLSDNAVVSDRTIDALGNQYTRWVQLDGIKNINSNVNFNRIFTVSTKNKITFGLGGGLNLTESNNILNSQKITSITEDVLVSPRMTFSLGNILDMNLRYNHTFRTNKFKNSVVDNFSYNIKNLNTDILFRPTKNWVINPKYVMSYRQLTGPNMPKYVHQLHANITYQFGKNQGTQITLTGFDLLKQNQSITRSIGDNFILDSRTTVLTQYFLLTFSYNINNFAAKTSKNLIRFW